MRLTFLGADHEVTGSCHFLQACGKNILIDCGMEQGNDVYENQELPVPASDVDYVLLTHAHIDHSGLIPLQYHTVEQIPLTYRWNVLPYGCAILPQTSECVRCLLT